MSTSTLRGTCPCLFFSHSVRVSLHPLFFGHALVSVLLAGSLALALGGLGGLLSGKVTLVASGHGVELSANKGIQYTIQAKAAT